YKINGKAGQVRYQNVIPCEWVQERGLLLMKIENKELAYTINIPLQPRRNMLWIRTDHSPKTPQNLMQ
ncbi:MAG TPA: hypothetical protein VEP90_27000, partial [Methylomirabilota bacterium]|nr:hypothetical protein [Methylomirabilota bacterium]